jgi:sugar diacid utilization regulator
MVGRPCANGAATGRIRALGDTVALARRISRVAPVETVPRRLHVMADVFVELGVARLPQVDEWLRGLAQRLASGPDLVATLDAFYRHDMNRLNTAGALRIHPRTLDYRFRRVRELVGMDPGSLQGVRVLSAMVARVLAGRWS